MCLNLIGWNKNKYNKKVISGQEVALMPVKKRNFLIYLFDSSIFLKYELV